jgi:hypothetical protein
MLLDASHRRWIAAVVALVAIATVAYVYYAKASLHGPRGGTWPGLAYGVAGLALMVYAGVLGLRRRFPTWRVGRATTWMKGHIWLGLAAYPLILFHTGFHVGGPLTLVLIVLLTLVVVSGVYGVAVQQFLPSEMLARVPLETVYEQIDSVVAQLRGEADALVAAAAGTLPIVEEPPPGRTRSGERRAHEPFVLPSLRPRSALVTAVPEGAAMREIYLVEIRPYLAPTHPDPRMAAPAIAAALFRHLRTVMPPTLHETVQELEAICDERRQLAHQKRLHHWLHGWLLVHVPLSMALLLLSLAHAVISLRY